MKKNYGLVIKNDDPNAYVLGGGSLPQVVLKEDGQWDAWLPVYEPQFNEFFDSYGCTVWGTLNAIEILIKRITNFEQNYSERFNYILAEIRPPGADPHHVAEVIRNRGVIDDYLLPMTKDFIEFLKPNPMTKKLLDEGMKFPFEFKHEYLWSGRVSKEERTKRMKEALRYSPLGVSVSAWHLKNGVYVDNSKPNNHWCVCYGWTNKGWKVFDSYDQSKKIVSFDHNIEVAKRFHLEQNNRLPKLWTIGEILKRLWEWLGILQKQQNEVSVLPVNSLPEPVLPQPEPIETPSKYDWDTPILARHSVRVIADEEGLTLEQKNTMCATIGGESGWDNNAKNPNYAFNSRGQKYLASTDWGICQINDHYHIGKDKSFPSVEYVVQNPEAVVRWMCTQWKRGRRNWWIAYKSGAYKRYL